MGGWVRGLDRQLRHNEKELAATFPPSFGAYGNCGVTHKQENTKKIKNICNNWPMFLDRFSFSFGLRLRHKQKSRCQGCFLIQACLDQYSPSKLLSPRRSRKRKMCECGGVMEWMHSTERVARSKNRRQEKKLSAATSFFAPQRRMSQASQPCAGVISKMGGKWGMSFGGHFKFSISSVHCKVFWRVSNYLFNIGSFLISSVSEEDEEFP